MWLLVVFSGLKWVGYMLDVVLETDQDQRGVHVGYNLAVH
jgi:hypothetical protein